MFLRLVNENGDIIYGFNRDTARDLYWELRENLDGYCSPEDLETDGLMKALDKVLYA